MQKLGKALDCMTSLNAPEVPVLLLLDSIKKVIFALNKVFL